MSLLQVQQEHLDAGGIGNDVVVTAAGPQEGVERNESAWQALTRLASVSVGMTTSEDNM